MQGSRVLEEKDEGMGAQGFCRFPVKKSRFNFLGVEGCGLKLPGKGFGSRIEGLRGLVVSELRACGEGAGLSERGLNPKLRGGSRML